MPMPRDKKIPATSPLIHEELHDYESLIRLKTMIDALPGDVYCKDKSGVWTSLNKHCAESLYRMGFIKEAKEDEVLGKTDYDLFDKQTADGYRGNDLEVMSARRQLTREETTLLPNGQKITLLSTKRPFFDKHNQVIGIVGNTFDITERKHMETELHHAKEKAEAANWAKTAFLENMRHDLRTPVSGIVGFSELIRLHANTPKLQEYATNLVAASHALLELLDEVLEAIRISSGEIPHMRKKFNLQHILNHIIQLNRPKALSKGLNLLLDWDSTLPHYVIGDKVRVHRIVLELIANALNFTDSGEVRLITRCAQKNHRELIIELRVEDTGIGIPKNKQQELYIQFNRLNPSYQGHYKGIGLGLSVVKQFIEELDGEIYVTSEPHKGTCFTCLIPLKEPLLNNDVGCDKSNEPATHVKPKPSLQSMDSFVSTPTGDYQILIVEDSFLAQAVAKSLLSYFRCDVDVADTGATALERVSQKKYDLIFMDVGLPDIEGYEVTAQLRKTYAQDLLPIIGLSAHADEEHKNKALDSGMNELLIKPLTAAQCEQLIQRFLVNKSPLSHSKNEDTHLLDLSQFPVLDVQNGIQSTGSEELLAQMLRFMLNETLNPDVTLMKEAYETQDWDSIQRLAHKIKGGAIYLGTVKMKMACEYLEHYWKAGKKELLEALYQQLIGTIEETTAEIKNYLINAE